MTEINEGALIIVAHQLKHLEKAWEKQMHNVVKIKGMSAKDIVDVIQEMTYVQGRLWASRVSIEDKLKKKGYE